MKRTTLAWNLASSGVIVAALGSISVHCNRDGGTREVVARVQIEAFHDALGRYHNDVGAYPPVASGLEALVYNPGVPNWRGPYLEKAIPLDPWGKQFLYGLDNNGRPIVRDSTHR